LSNRTDAVPPSPDGVHSEHILRVASAPSTAAVTDSPDFQVADAPLQIQFASAKCVCYASLCSGGRRLAVRTAMEHPIGALPRTPFPASRDFAPVGSMSLDFQVASLSYKSSSFATSRGNEKIGGTGYCVTYDTDSQSRNADFISIARRAIHNPRGQRPRQT
jgi:hypothetical protein